MGKADTPLKINLKTMYDQDILEFLENIKDPEEYIKALIRQDMKKTSPVTREFNIQLFAESDKPEIEPIDVDSFDELIKENEKQREKAENNITYLKKLKRGFEQIKAGKGQQHDLIEV